MQDIYKDTKINKINTILYYILVTWYGIEFILATFVSPKSCHLLKEN